MQESKVLTLPIVARNGTDADKLLKEAKEIKERIDSSLRSGYKLEATHTIVLGEVAYLVYSLLKEA